MQFVPDDAIHPGEILKQDFLIEYDLSIEQAASDLGISAEVLTDIVNGSGAITAEVALRLARYFETSPELWLNLQRSYDLSLAMKSAAGLENIRPVRAA
jgi:addiction module HigA family antidote